MIPNKPLKFYMGSKKDIQDIFPKAPPEPPKKIINVVRWDRNTQSVCISLEEYNESIIIALRALPLEHRDYEPKSKTNIINVKSWQSFLSLISEQLKSTHVLVYADNTELAISEYLNKPDITVDVNLHKSRVDIELLKIAYLYLPKLSSLVRERDRSYSFALAELYRFPEALKDNYSSLKVSYTDKAMELLTAQLERRRLMNEILNATDAPEQVNRLLIPPRNFQRVADKFLELNNDRGLIAYDMGLGKSFIALNRAEISEYKKVLIICPAQLKTNWAREIKKLTGKDCNFLAGSIPTDLDVKSLLEQRYKYNIINYDIIGKAIKDKDGGNKTMLWVEIINLWQPDLVIMDEIHYIKNMESQRSIGVRALEIKRVIELSGTPLVNRIKELFPALNVISPTDFHNSNAFYAQFLSSDGKSVKNLRHLQEVLTGYMIRRQKKDVINDLPPITRIDWNAEQSEQGKKLYKEILAGLYTSLRNPKYQRDVSGILAEITRLKQNTSADKVRATVDLAYLIQEEKEESESKTLIFSQFVETCREIAFTLGPDCLCITGEDSNEARYEAMDKFQKEDKYKFFVLSTKVGSEGITLTKAHNIIFNDLMWTPKDHMQAEARAYGRLNDMHGATSYYVIIPNTIDEWIYELIKKKLRLIEAVIDGTQNVAKENESIIGELINKLRMMI